MLLSSVSSGLLLKNEKPNLAAIALIPFLMSTAYIIYLLTHTSNLHLLAEQIKNLNADYKGENDTKFSPDYKKESEGIRLNGKRYKFVNGTDICLNDKNEIVPCGFGSSIIQCMGGGGLEPKSIQEDEKWK